MQTQGQHANNTQKEIRSSPWGQTRVDLYLWSISWPKSPVFCIQQLVAPKNRAKRRLNVSVSTGRFNKYHIFSLFRI